MHTITKEKLSQKLHDKLGLSAAICEDLVSEIFVSAADIICSSTNLKIKNFGSFNISTKKERPGMDWVSGSSISIPERRVIRFTPSRNLKARLK
ncbi:MAG: HU family DNA-binding protein [Pseudomonadota bacterium]